MQSGLCGLFLSKANASKGYACNAKTKNNEFLHIGLSPSPRGEASSALLLERCIVCAGRLYIGSPTAHKRTHSRERHPATTALPLQRTPLIGELSRNGADFDCDRVHLPTSRWANGDPVQPSHGHRLHMVHGWAHT
jgi:hypothetical protein